MQSWRVRLEAASTWLLRHWLALFLVVWALFVLLPVAAPILAASGHRTTSSFIYSAYRITCHQFPHRSWFLFGKQAEYDWPTVAQHLGIDPSSEAEAFHRPIRDSELGYQVAFCQRDLATQLGLLATGAVFALRRRRRSVRPLSLWLYILAVVPLAADGLLQLLGVRESSALSRTATGLIFGAASGWLLLPSLDEAIADVLRWSEKKTAPSGATSPAPRMAKGV